MNNVVSLKDLFYRRVFQIPDYQRSYSWEHQQVQEFLEDLEFLPSNKHHYTGTIVIHESDSATDLMDENGDSYDRVDIVDGQQRLTTIILLLDGIRRHLERRSKKAKKLSRGIRKNYISARDMNGQTLYRLSLNSNTECTSYCDAYRPGRTDAFAAYADAPEVQQDIKEWSTKLVRVGVMAPFLPLLLSVRERWPDRPGRYLELLRRANGTLSRSRDEGAGCLNGPRRGGRLILVNWKDRRRQLQAGS